MRQVINMFNILNDGEGYIPALKGEDGKSAYEIAVDDGFIGTEEEWLESLVGASGETPNIQIGTVTTLEPNQPATVTRTGTDEEPIFDFSIPRGKTGFIEEDKYDVIIKSQSEFEIYLASKSEQFPDRYVISESVYLDGVFEYGYAHSMRTSHIELASGGSISGGTLLISDISISNLFKTGTVSNPPSINNTTLVLSGVGKTDNNVSEFTLVSGIKLNNVTITTVTDNSIYDQTIFGSNLTNITFVSGSTTCNNVRVRIDIKNTMNNVSMITGFENCSNIKDSSFQEWITDDTSIKQISILGYSNCNNLERCTSNAIITTMLADSTVYFTGFIHCDNLLSCSVDGSGAPVPYKPYREYTGYNNCAYGVLNKATFSDRVDVFKNTEGDMIKWSSESNDV